MKNNHSHPYAFQATGGFKLSLKAGLLIAITGLIINGISITKVYADKERNNNPKQLNDDLKKWGIKVLSLRQTAAGYMLDFRYKVVNPEKAGLFLNRKNKAHLKILKNGLYLKVPVTAKIGPLRQSAKTAKAGKNYFMFFGNPGRMVEAGDKVQVQIGNYKSKILTIE